MNVQSRTRRVATLADSLISMSTRRSFLATAGMAAIGNTLPAFSQITSPPAIDPDFRLMIDLCSFEVARNKFLKTISYNQQIPGPALKLTQGRLVTVDVTNRTSRPEIVHWHGLGLPPQIDGAMEEGTPMIAPRATTRFAFTPRQSGLRWYHTHTTAEADLQIAQYSGQHGLLLIDPATRPATRYDKEFSLVLHDWDGQFQGADDGTMQPGLQLLDHQRSRGRIQRAFARKDGRPRPVPNTECERHRRSLA
jgi:FtsP/CotA-like multicopper oxidase with cupredoxin domain